MLPRERPRAPPGTSNPGNTITYAELHVKPQPQGNSRAETSASGCRHRSSAWFYVALVLAVLVLILLGIVVIQAKLVLKGRAGESESLPQYGLNSTSSDISSERTIPAALLKWLMEELCEDGQGTRCELCPPGWQLHRGRCYFFSEETRSWEDSQKNCLARKSQLLVIEDEIEMVSHAAALKTHHRPQVNKRKWPGSLLTANILLIIPQEFIDNKDKDTKYIWIGSEDMKKTRSSVEDHRIKEKR
uniref:Uncharacterized protein n=1 Tax=Catharus ustulatus TaxID=91951 RepID=A0A8C3V2M9_CATUS